jgi:hypothetical protein
MPAMVAGLAVVNSMFAIKIPDNITYLNKSCLI